MVLSIVVVIMTPYLLAALPQMVMICMIWWGTSRSGWKIGDAYPGGDSSASAYYGETTRVSRGGSHHIYDSDLRVASRNPGNNPHYGLGFRCARSP
jgi:formylglycine-generating enzyme required for sulfatase activity